MDNTFEIVSLSIAWLLGLLGPTIVRRIERRYQAKEIGAGILAETAHLRYTLAIVAFRLRTRLKTFDAEFVTWFASVAQVGDEDDEDAPRWRSGVQKLLTLPPAQLNSAAAALTTPGQATRVTPYSLPYLESQLGQLHLFPTDVQRRLMSVRCYLTLFNSEAEFVRTMLGLTFDPSVMQVNSGPIEENLNTSYQTLARRSERLAREIGELLDKHSTSFRS